VLAQLLDNQMSVAALNNACNAYNIKLNKGANKGKIRNVLKDYLVKCTKQQEPDAALH
jgi:hypothetical protein